MENKPRGQGFLSTATTIILVILYLSLRPTIEVGAIVLVRRGAFPSFWIVLLLFALSVASFVLGEMAGSLRGRFYAMEYSDHERAEKLYGPRVRRFSSINLLVQLVHIIVFLFVLGQNLFVLANG